jgi:chorismate dehydratase
MLYGEQKDLFELTYCVPSECADRVERGLADIGIVPAIELARQDLEVIRGAGIACRGPVRSILLISKTPLSRIRTLAADSSSRTSVVLARILLAECHGAEPKVVLMPPGLDPMLEAADAALIIGDPALRIDPASLPYFVSDLGEQWSVLTGMPMVFAVWAGPRRAIQPWMEQAFAGSCRFGLEHLEDIVAQECARRGISAELARQYLTRHIVSELAEREYQGLELFLQYAAKFDSVIPSEAATL